MVAAYALNVSAAIVSAGTMTEQVEFLLSQLETNFIPTEVEIEGSIVILLACFGVFLEHRRYLLSKIYPDGVPDALARFDRSSHHIGVMFIMIAILTEFLDLFFLALNSWGLVMKSVQVTEVAILFAINGATFLCVAAFIVWVIRERLRNQAIEGKAMADPATRTAPHYN